MQGDWCVPSVYDAADRVNLPGRCNIIDNVRITDGPLAGDLAGDCTEAGQDSLEK